MSTEIIHNEHIAMMPIEQAHDWYNNFVKFTKSVLKESLDFGVIPGTPKPSLYKPGAEKLRVVYGLGAEFECTDKTTDLDRHFVDYSYKCSITSKTGQILAQCDGNCNSMEAKFGYLWKTANELEGVDLSKLQSKTSGKKLMEFSFAIDKAETSGQYGKPEKYWNDWKEAIKSGKAVKIQKETKSGKKMDAFEMGSEVTVYRIANPDVIGMKNTIMKMAQKRAFVGAILLATGASEFFTQDIEDMEINGTIHSEDIDHEEVKKESKEEKEEPLSTIETQVRTKQNSVDDIEMILGLCENIPQLNNLYHINSQLIEANPSLKLQFTKRKEEIRGLIAA